MALRSILAASALCASAAGRQTIGRKATRQRAGDADPDILHGLFVAEKARHDAYLASGTRVSDAPDYYTPVWPMPAQFATVGNVALDPATFTILLAQEDEFLMNAAKRYLPLILYHPNGASPDPSVTTLATLTVNVTDLSVKQIQLGTDESYTLTFTPDQTAGTIHAKTVFGALRGLETFSQLVEADKWSGLYSVGAATVTDAPRFPFRGLLVDAARHFLPPKLLLTIMDGLMYSKLNVLKIVLGCDWSWTVQSKTWPNMTLASYYADEQDHVYNISVMKALVKEANYRGVRILPFFETIGHSSAIGQAYPELVWCNGKQGTGLPHPFKNLTWDFFDTLWQDYREVFADNQMNIGGDEIDVTCWQNDTVIEAWMKEHGYTDLGYVVSYYYQRMMTSLKKSGFSAIFFGEAFDVLNSTGANLTQWGEVTFDGWDEGTPQSQAPVLTAPGAKSIISSYCYLAPITIPGTFNVPGGATWETNYLCDLSNITGVPAAAIEQNMLGGHVSRWGEMTDATNIFQFSWPAILGTAEKLWTPANLTNPYAQGYGDRQYMIATAYRCVMVRRGIPMSPMTYAWSCPFEMEVPYPFVAPSTKWWPESTFPTAGGAAAVAIQPLAADAAAENAALRARVAQLEAQLAALTAA